MGRTFVSHSFGLGLAGGLTQTVPETSARCGKDAQMEVINKIMGEPCSD